MAETTEEYRNRINQLKTSIENEPYIQKMREDIAEGISKTGNRQADIEVRQDKLEDDFVAVQQDARSNTPSGAELAVAAGSYNTLGERLDAEQNEVNAQLAQTKEMTAGLKQKSSYEVDNYSHMLNGAIGALSSSPLTTITNAINDDKKHVAFPTVIADGNNLLLLYRRGTDHITNPDGTISQKTSIDGGQTWSAEKIMYVPPTTHDARDPNLIMVSPTNVLCIMPIVKKEGPNITGVENEVWKTTDFGGTWSKIANLPKKQGISFYQIVRGQITKSTSGRIVVPVWSADLSTSATEDSFVIYSDDNGISWHIGGTILPTGATETSVEYDQYNRLWAVMRNDPSLSINRYTNMLMSYSDDNGMSWSIPHELPITGHAPHLLKLNDGLLLTWRNTDPYKVNSAQERYSVNFCKLNGGAISSDVYELLNSQSPDIGYPWAAKNGESVFIIFYVFATNIASNIYMKKLELSKMNQLSFSKTQPVNYTNYTGVNREIYARKDFAGDTYVQGNNTDIAVKTVYLPLTVKGIRHVNVEVFNNDNANFITAVKNLTASSFDVVVRNISGNFSNQVGIFYNVLAEV